jgi:cytochrome c biogenesis protein
MSTVDPGTRDSQARDDESATADLSTQPKSDVPGAAVGLGVRGWLRWMWRQLTSMRTALLLLFLLAIGSIPGSILPQEPVQPSEVTRYIADNPGLGEFFDAIGFFNVFSAPWYVAIYLLLLVSLVGCIIPRTRLHWRAMRSTPPKAPSRLSRLAESSSWQADSTAPAPQDILNEAAEELKGKRWRVHVTDFNGSTGAVSAEKGYLRETGNLIFHVALLVLLLAVALGGMFGWRGQALVIEDESFSNTITQYDSFNAGRLVDAGNLPPFSLTLDEFTATYQEEGDQQGAPRTFEADVTFRDSPDATSAQQRVEVNSPLVVDGAKAFLVGHGYAPVIEVRDAQGQVVYEAPTVFLQTDGNFTSNGVVKLPDVDPQLGFQALFLPTAAVDEVRGPISTFPALNDPAIFLSAWEGDLGLDDGIPQSVYRMDTANMTQLGIKAIRPGETWEIPDGRGTVSLTGVKQYAVFDVAYDPARFYALAGSIFALLGLMLSLFVPRRRVFVRVTHRRTDSTAGQGAAGAHIEVAGLSRTDEAGLKPAVEEITAVVRKIVPPVPESTMEPMDVATADGADDTGDSTTGRTGQEQRPDA